ncbi:hypothetical protein C2E21_0749 [Chlorella sorokiniana]|uniref:Uncharacterized protein n=1 Tax=Chlorella sorokiniana TaxID=3076 RepID=A0A2P6U1N6_CHLSO|nr:hypothetical protein C2E21_0749 [Chlorella sorokiniana]|eukprot:PRW60209.1 hypothetical protein C2E21_0749 [Chlorella sorokiniana]
MAERRVSKRERRKPQLFGCFGVPDQAEEPEPQQAVSDAEEEEQEEEQPLRKRSRRQRRRAADSEAEEEEEEGAPAAAAGRGGGGGRSVTKRTARQPRKQRQQQQEALPPPAQPLSSADFVGALHACPTLIDMILQADGLRTPTLLARDAANLAVALCATSEQMDGAWRTLAARAAGAEGFAGTTEEAMAAAQAAVKADPARRQRCTTTTAKQDYRLSDKDLEGLEYVTRDNPIFWSAAPTRLYRVLDCLAIAHRKYGDLAGIQAVKAKTAERGQKVKATRQGNTQRRTQEMEAAMQAQGLNSWRYRKHAGVTGFIKHGRGTAAEVAAGLKKIEDKEAQAAQRRVQLAERLQQEGLSAVEWRFVPAAERFIAGEGKETLASAVAAVKKEKAVREECSQRSEALRSRLEKEGLLSDNTYFSAEEYMQFYITGARSYIATGEGSMASIVKSARAERKAKAQQKESAKQREQQVEERREQARAALEEAGIDWDGHELYEVPALYSFVHQGKGCEEDFMPAAHAFMQRQAERQARRAHFDALMQGAGLNDVAYRYTIAAQRYLETGEGDDESLLAAGRAEKERLAERDQLYEQETAKQRAMSERSARVAQLLRDNGLPSFYAFSVASIAYYIETGEGSDAAALADAKRHHSSKPHAQLLAEIMANAEAGGAAGGAGGAAGGAAGGGAGGAADGDGGAAAAAAAAGPFVW